MIEFILSAVAIWGVFALLDRLFRRKPTQPMLSPGQVEELVIREAAASIGVTPSRFREMLKQESAPAPGSPRLRIVK